MWLATLAQRLHSVRELVVFVSSTHGNIRVADSGAIEGLPLTHNRQLVSARHATDTSLLNPNRIPVASSDSLLKDADHR